MSKGKFYSGTSGLVLPVKNKAGYPDAYKDKSRLTFYSSLFNSIEINSSFYKLPLPRTVARWVTETGGPFNFTFKLWRNITHNKNLQFDPVDIHKFMNIVNEAGDKKGCLLIQFPASTKVANIYQLDYLLSELKGLSKGWKIAVEFRDNSWYNDKVYALLKKYKAGLVIHDIAKSATPLNDAMTASFIYLRLHGTNGRYGGSYSDDVLHDYAALISEWMDDGKDVYCYFNNTMGDAVNNLITLNDLVKNL